MVIDPLLWADEFPIVKHAYSPLMLSVVSLKYNEELLKT